MRRARNEQLDYDTLYGTFTSAAPHGFQPFRGTTTAWDLARGSSTLADVPYRLRAVLQNRYAELVQVRSENDGVLAQLEAAPTDARPNFFFVGNALELILLDLVFSEDYLARDDQVALDALRGAGIP
jgi:hypothetical protein